MAAAGLVVRKAWEGGGGVAIAGAQQTLKGILSACARACVRERHHFYFSEQLIRLSLDDHLE